MLLKGGYNGGVEREVGPDKGAMEAAHAPSCHLFKAACRLAVCLPYCAGHPPSAGCPSSCSCWFVGDNLLTMLGMFLVQP